MQGMTPKFAIRRGSTPTLAFTLPLELDAGKDKQSLYAVWVRLSQSGFALLESHPSHGFAVPAPFALHGFDLTNRAARSWSLTHTQGSLWCPAPLGVQCKLAGATPQSR